MWTTEIVIQETHRGPLFTDGRFTSVLSPGRCHITRDNPWRRFLRRSIAKVVVVDIDAEKARTDAETARVKAEADAAAQRIRTTAEVQAVRERATVAEAYAANPALLRLEELRAPRELSTVATARLYIGFDTGRPPTDADGTGER